MSGKQPNLWEFIDERGSFRVQNADTTTRLYFPLANEAGMLANITPELKGSIKTGHHSYLTLPVSTDDLHNIKSSRNFWIRTDNNKVWSITGVSANRHQYREKSSLAAGLLWHELERKNSALGLKAKITNFIPASGEKVEIMLAVVTNTSRSAKSLDATFAVPVFGRSADRLRDHRHVTSLLNRVRLHTHGVLVTPTMSFDERGHRVNRLTYSVLGLDDKSRRPVQFFPTVESFIGEGGNLERPSSVFKPRASHSPNGIQGKEVMGAFRFKKRTLRAGGSATYTILLGIADHPKEISDWIKKFNKVKKVNRSFEQTKKFWNRKTGQISIETCDSLYDGWLKWVSAQPTLRNIFGNSFLPDFDYGRGGRGWRDIWQDCLGLFLTHPEETKEILLHNFGGIRIDGSNATIISWPKHEFIADRNNISRVWMDHGIWPFVTTELYIHQTGDLGFLLKKSTYFRDQRLSRSQAADNSWTPRYGKRLKTKTGKIYTGTLLEHILVQHLVQFFNVGPHNHTRLESADWNDGLDMAYDRGESVAFTCFYAGNLNRLADLIEMLSRKYRLNKISIAKELALLLDAGKRNQAKYSSRTYKRKVLDKYFSSVQTEVSGRIVRIPVADLIRDLRSKADYIFDHTRQNEWVKTRSGHGFFNGYYDNKSRRVEGDHAKGVRMTLTGQVFPIMSGAATESQIREIVRSVKRFLVDPRLGGVRLNTDFHEIQPHLGRAFSFAYGDKENGAFFSHMAVMYAYALYKRGFAEEGYRVLNSIFKMCVNTRTSQIYPGLPEYFNSEGRGLYHYLTGSASWYLLTLFTEVLGIRGLTGDMVLDPKLVKEQFRRSDTISVKFQFAGRRIHLEYMNPARLSFGRYRIQAIGVNGKHIASSLLQKEKCIIPRRLILKLSKNRTHHFKVLLG